MSICSVSFILSVANKNIVLSVIMLNVVMLDVVALAVKLIKEVLGLIWVSFNFKLGCFANKVGNSTA